MIGKQMKEWKQNRDKKKLYKRNKKQKNEHKNSHKNSNEQI